MKYVCSKCGSANIQIQMWVNPNTQEVMNDVNDESECWCEDCLNYEKYLIKKE